MGVEGRYKGVEGRCRRYGDIWEYKDDTREQRGYVEGYGDVWGYKDDTTPLCKSSHAYQAFF